MCNGGGIRLYEVHSWLCSIILTVNELQKYIRSFLQFSQYLLTVWRGNPGKENDFFVVFSFILQFFIHDVAVNSSLFFLEILTLRQVLVLFQNCSQNYVYVVDQTLIFSFFLFLFQKTTRQYVCRRRLLVVSVSSDFFSCISTRTRFQNIQLLAENISHQKASYNKYLGCGLYSRSGFYLMKSMNINRT